MKRTFRLTLRAHEDLKSIARYTRLQWGEAQRERYIRALDKRFRWLAEHPQAGRHRPDIAEGYFSFSQGSLLIFYQVSTSTIDIIGIPHSRMDVSGYFAVKESQEYANSLHDAVSKIRPAAAPSNSPRCHAPAR